MIIAAGKYTDTTHLVEPSLGTIDTTGIEVLD
jgi:hypothetical protein